MSDRVQGNILELTVVSFKITLAWIRVVEECEAGSDLSTEYENVRQKRGSVPNVMKVHSLDPKSMGLHLDLYLHLMFGKSTLTRTQREMIAVLVSQTNQCHYCVTHHGEALLAHVHDTDHLEAIKADFQRATLTPKDQAMLRYSVKLTTDLGSVSEKDVNELRHVGFTDEEILRINLIASYFNFANRIVSGLGVGLEPAEARAYKY